MFADTGSGEDVADFAADEWSIYAVSNNLEVVRVNNRSDDAGDATADMETEDRKIGKASAAD